MTRIDGRLAAGRDLASRRDADQWEGKAAVPASLPGGLHDSRLRATVADRDPPPALGEQSQRLEYRQQPPLMVFLHLRGATAEEHKGIGLTANLANERRQLLVRVGCDARNLEHTGS